MGEPSPSTFKSCFSQSWTGLKASIQRLRLLPILLILVTYLRVDPEGLAYGQL